MMDATLAAFLSSERVLVLPLMVTYFGSKPRSTSTPSSRVGRSRTCPTVALTSYPAPRYLPMVFAFVGDSTITSELPSPRPLPRGVPPFGLAAAPAAASAAAGLLRLGAFTVRFGLV